MTCFINSADYASCYYYTTNLMRDEKSRLELEEDCVLGRLRLGLNHCAARFSKGGVIRVEICSSSSFQKQKSSAQVIKCSQQHTGSHLSFS